MAGIGIGGLPVPPAQFRPDYSAPLNDGAHFETEEEAKIEDWRRADMLQSFSQLYSDADAGALAKRLRRRVREVHSSATLASALDFRDCRIRVAGNLWRLMHSRMEERTSSFTVVPRSGLIAAQDLNEFNPRRFLESFRLDLYRSGATDAGGYLFAAVHGELEPESERFQIHLHGLAAGGMRSVIDQLRHRPKYRANQLDGAARPVRRSHRPLHSTSYALTYLLQSWWPARRIGEVGTGEIRRARQRGRMPEPFHSQFLLWLDNQRLSDLTLLFGIAAGRDGFRARHAYTNEQQE
jgi:hypothetical protein